MKKLSEYNQAFKDALQFVSKFVYMSKGTKTLQSQITDLCHWLEENPTISKGKLLEKLAEILRKFIQHERY